MSKYERLVTFVTVFEEASFAACAKKLKISPAAVSKQISTLEKELGFMLFTRSTRKLALTEAGLHYFEQAKKVIREMAEIDALAQEVQKEPFGMLKVASLRYYAEHSILPHLPAFLNTYPKLQLNLELIERFPDLDREEIDIVVGLSRPLSLDSIQKTIGYTDYCMCASKKYLKKL